MIAGPIGGTIVVIVWTLFVLVVAWQFLRWVGRWMLYRMCRTVPAEVGQRWDLGGGRVEMIVSTEDDHLVTRRLGATSLLTEVYSMERWACELRDHHAFLVEIPAE